MKNNVDRIIAFQEKEILQDTGKISSLQMKEKVKELYDRFHQRRKITEAQEADNQDIEELKIIEDKIKKEQ